MDLKEKIPKIKENVSLAKYTTFKIGGPARYFWKAKSKEDLIKTIRVAKKFKLPFFILGAGSNVLFSDKGFNGLVVKCQMSNVKCQQDKIYAEAGTRLDSLVRLAEKKSLTGLEWMAGIPGTVGGAVYGNAQAFSIKMSDLIENVEVLNTKNLEIENLSSKECLFSTKNSIFKKNKNLIIISAVLKLKKGDKEKIQKRTKEYLNHRKKSHPLKFPSAGSIFVNPEIKIKDPKLLKKFPEFKKFNKKGIIPAGYLIEKCGLKGKRIGNARISKKHANFIVNSGGAKASEVIKLIKLAKKEVKRKFGISLKEEVQIVS